MMRGHAKALYDLGGVIGFGVEKNLKDDPGSGIIGRWLSDYQDARSAVGNQPMAIGTDMNGFAPQIPYGDGPIVYPLRVASQTGTPPPGFTPPSLGQFIVALRTYDFQLDGIANYGLLPEFMQSLADKPGSQPPLESLYFIRRRGGADVGEGRGRQYASSHTRHGLSFTTSGAGAA